MTNLASDATPNSPEAINRKSIALIQEFVHAVQKEFPGRVAFLPYGDSDAEGADFGFYLEVCSSDYERALDATSRLEAEFYNKYGLNFVVFPTVTQPARAN